LTPPLQIPANSPNPFCTTDLTFTVNNTPPTDAKCTTGAAPLNCCTGAGTGFCEKTDNAACTEVLTPFPCCTGAGTGFCGFSNADCTGPLAPVECCVGAGTGFCNVIQSGSNASCTTGCSAVHLLHRRGHGVLRMQGQRGLHGLPPAVSLLPRRHGSWELRRPLPAQRVRPRAVRQPRPGIVPNSDRRAPGVHRNRPV
jgi:hypothetical protein